MKNNHAQRIASATPPPSGRKAFLNLAPRDVKGLLEELKKYHTIFAPLFQRPEQRHWSLKYLEGQMLELERKSIEPMARALEGGNVQAMQQLISASPWGDEAVIETHQHKVAQTLGRHNGVLILDGLDNPKQGTHSIGVARQHCGPLGKRASCQASVVLAYASDLGYTLLDRRLYLPEKWFETPYATAARVDEVAKALPQKLWRKVIVHEGTKGPLEVEIAVLRCVFSEEALPAREEWLVLRRKSSRQPLDQWKFFRANAAKKTSWKKLAQKTAWRWPIESTIEECKVELGLDHYEVRNWRGWHHHMTLTMLAHHFLVRLRVKLGKAAPALTVSQARKLLQVVLPKREFDAKTILQEIKKTQQQNYAAYRSHRKRQKTAALT